MAAPASVPSSLPTPSASGIPAPPDGVAAAATGTAIGAAAGAAAGAIAGPPGIIAGAVLGAIAGAATGKALVDNDADEATVDEHLDEEIGVIGGDLGAAQTTIPARIGAPSLASAGIGAPTSPNEEGGTGVVGSDESDD